MPFSKKAIWSAVYSGYGDRLVEIALEHMELADKIPQRPSEFMKAQGIDPLREVREILTARIAQLKKERNEIIQQFEED